MEKGWGKLLGFKKQQERPLESDESNNDDDRLTDFELMTNISDPAPNPEESMLEREAETAKGERFFASKKQEEEHRMRDILREE